MGSSRVRASKNSTLVASDLTARFAPVSAILRGLSRDTLIFSIFENDVQPEFASGRFSELMQSALSPSFDSLARPLALKIGSAVVVDIDDEARTKLGLSGFPNGALALICLDASASRLTCAAIYESDQNGSLAADQIAALQATARLVERAGEPVSQDVAQLRNFYRRFSQSIHQCFWILDRESAAVLSISENFEDVWGAQRSILMNDGLTGFMANVMPEDRDRLLADFHEHLDIDFDSEFRVLDRSGTVRWMRLRSSRFDDESMPERHLILLIADDVTEKKQFDDRHRSQEAAIVSRARSLAVVDLASGVAHEINNPLTIIVGRASELRRRILTGEVSQETQIEFVDKIQATALRIADIVKSLKSLSRQDRGSDFKVCDFASLSHEVLDLSFERCKSQNVKLEVEIPDRELVAEMNPTLISQVVLNLINNAADAVGELPERWVKVDFTADDDSIYVGVTDSGSGIPIKIRSRIFDPFFTTKGPHKGTGLGLSLSMSIAAHHDGALRIDTLHAHTRFVLQIPKRQTKLKIA